jgi:hypothetical protein
MKPFFLYSLLLFFLWVACGNPDPKKTSDTEKPLIAQQLDTVTVPDDIPGPAETDSGKVTGDINKTDPTSDKPAIQPKKEKIIIQPATSANNPAAPYPAKPKGTPAHAVVKSDTLPFVQPEPPGKKPALSHEIWDQLLGKYVSSAGKVNYSGLKGEGFQLAQYLEILQQNPPAPGWSQNKKLAYYLNLYNAATVDLILRHYPIGSIMEIDNAWKKEIVRSGNATFSLDHLENGIIRPEFNDPRIHFAANCGAISCPKLRNEAYQEDILQRQLEDQSRAFIGNPDRNVLTPKKLELSRIFEWYSADFTKNGTLIDFIRRYYNGEISEKASVSYLEYDWSLNGN